MATLKELVTLDIQDFFRIRGAMQVAPMLFNEKEFQMQLVLFLNQSKAAYDNIYMEYFIPQTIFNKLDKTALYPWDSNLYIDIVVVKDGEYFPIELKYKLKNVDVSVDRFGQPFEKIVRHQGAQDLGCYGFWRDVKRIECVTKIFNPRVKGGLAIFLTNDQHYWEGDVKKGSGHIEFSLSNKAVQTDSKCWQNKGKAAMAQSLIDFKVKKVYNVAWQRAYNVTPSLTTKKKDNGLFQYCMVEI